MQKPSIGRIVHYTLNDTDKTDQAFDLVDPASDTLPAIVVGVNVDETTVDLRVFGRSHRDLPYLPNVPFVELGVDDKADTPGTWHWPPRN